MVLGVFRNIISESYSFEVGHLSNSEHKILSNPSIFHNIDFPFYSEIMNKSCFKLKNSRITKN